MGIKKKIIVVLFAFVGFIAVGQEAYLRHTVMAGETVFAIARQYNITPEELLKYNPDAASILREGSILIIPNASISKPATVQTHTVKPQETLYGLSKLYNCTVDELLAMNPELKDGLKIGMVIKVPKSVSKAVVQKSREDSAKYEFRVVEPKETVYSICKSADITEDAFLKLNPEVRERGLQIGMVIKLPKNIDNQPVVTENVPTDETNSNTAQQLYELYFVKPDDSLIEIAQRFSTTVANLIKLNPELSGGLKPGRYIVVPSVKKEQLVVVNKSPSSNMFYHLPSSNFKTKVRIAAVLPLYISKNDSLATSGQNAKKGVYERSKIGLAFYSGLRLAVDTLAALGYHVILDVYDTENSLQKTAEIAQKIHPKTDVVIGPLYSKNAEKLAQLLPDKMVVSPLSKTVDNTNLPNLIDGVNYLGGEYRAMADWISANYKQRHIVFLNTQAEQNKKSVSIIVENCKNVDSNAVKYYWVDEDFKQLGLIDNYIESGKPTTFVVVDQNAAFLSDLLRRMNRTRDSSLSILCTSRIFDIPALENRYLNKLNFISTSNDFLNVQDTLTQQFISAYRRLTGTEPDRFAYYGYDTGLYFAQLAAKNGKLRNVEEWPVVKGVHKGFKFMAIPGLGPVNIYSYYVGIKNYKLVERQQ